MNLQRSLSRVALLAGVTAFSLPTGAQQAAGLAPQLAEPQHVPEQPVVSDLELPRLRTPIHTAAEDGGLSYGTWAAGHDYKVSFHDGMTFVPYLGGDYPRNQPWSWRTTSATIGGVDLAGAKSPRHEHGDFRYEYHFAGVVEAYDVLAHGLEQTFVIDELPADGDLVITGAVSTDLSCADQAAVHREIAFSDAEGREIVSYGKAWAYDATGARRELETSFHDGEITLRVPGAWLANASLPIVVDPLLSRKYVSGGSSSPVGEVDICWDGETGGQSVMIAYTRNASAVDSDVWAVLVNFNLQGPDLVFSDITSVWDTNECSCAYVGGADRYLLAVGRYFRNSAVRASAIRAHVHDSGSTAFNAFVVALNLAPSQNAWRIDVGGVASGSSGATGLVVFQAEDNAANSGNLANTATSSVMAVPVTMSGFGSFGNPFFVATGSQLDAERPTVNQVAQQARWVCAYQLHDGGQPAARWDVRARQLTTSSRSLGSFLADQAGRSRHQLGPVIAGSGGRYAIGFTAAEFAAVPFKTTLIAGTDLQTQRFDWADGLQAPQSSRPPVTIRSNGDRRWEATGLAYDTNDRSHFGLGFRAVTPGTPIAYFARLGYQGAVTEGGNNSAVLYYGANERPTPVACAFDASRDNFLFAYGVDDVGNTNPVYGHGLSYPSVASPLVTGAGCSSGTIGWAGNQQIGSEFQSVVASNSSPVGYFMLVSLSHANLPVASPLVPTNCRLFVDIGAPNFLAALPYQYGTTGGWQFPLPEWLDPLTLHFQAWLFDGSSFQSTSRLVVSFVR
ncbi:MAG: hypothetical protein NXI31_10305 [bacterium]|nr:hypothetical protein [bacterium]